MLRRATLEDASVIFRLHMASIRTLAANSYSPEQIEAWCAGRTPENYHAPIQTQVVFVVEAHEQILGFSQLAPEQSLIVAVYVDPEHARKGIGLRLLRVLEAHAVNLGIRTLQLQASLNAVSFYEHAGYAKGELTHHMVAGGVSLPCRAMSRALQ